MRNGGKIFGVFDFLLLCVDVLGKILDVFDDHRYAVALAKNRIQLNVFIDRLFGNLIRLMNGTARLKNTADRIYRAFTIFRSLCDQRGIGMQLKIFSPKRLEPLPIAEHQTAVFVVHRHQVGNRLKRAFQQMPRFPQLLLGDTSLRHIAGDAVETQYDAVRVDNRIIDAGVPGTTVVSQQTTNLELDRLALPADTQRIANNFEVFRVNDR